MDEQGLELLRQLISDIEGAPSPGLVGLELYGIWFEHAQSVAQEALEYIDRVDPGHDREGGLPPISHDAVEMEIPIREACYGACPYLEGRSWQVGEFSVRSLSPLVYERLLAEGWRRSGSTFYRDTCPGCARCVPIRLDVASFKPSRSQKRLLRINEDIEQTLIPAGFTEERYDLYRRYVAAQHGAAEGPSPLARASYASFLLGSPLGNSGIFEYRRRTGGELVATGYVDQLPGGLSSVYFAWDPKEAKRSLGTWSVLMELAYAASRGTGLYYLGFWVPGSPKMDYKASFRPFEVAVAGEWHSTRDRQAALDMIGARGLDREFGR